MVILSVLKHTFLASNECLLSTMPISFQEILLLQHFVRLQSSSFSSAVVDFLSGSLRFRYEKLLQLAVAECVHLQKRQLIKVHHHIKCLLNPTSPLLNLCEIIYSFKRCQVC